MVSIVRTYTERVTLWIRYSLLRLGLFGAVFALLLILQLAWWVAALVATIVAFTLSYIFFYRFRNEVAGNLQARLNKPTKLDPDSQSEDELTSQDEGDTKS